MKEGHDRHWQHVLCSVCGCMPDFDGKMNHPLQCVGCLAIFCTDCYEKHYAEKETSTPLRCKDMHEITIDTIDGVLTCHWCGYQGGFEWFDENHKVE